MIDHIATCAKREIEEQRYRTYVTDALRILTENSTHYLVPGVGNVNFGVYLKERWYKPHDKPEDTRTGDEIAADVIKRAGLRMAGGGERA